MFKHMYWKWENALTPETCEFFINSMDWASVEEGTVYGSEDEKQRINNPDVRKTDVLFVDAFGVIGSFLQTRVALANQNAGWNMRIDSMEDPQIGRYSKGSFYDWHRDSGIPNSQGQIRKLTIVLALSNPEDYEGGDFEFKDDHLELSRLKQGDVIVFPSYLKHRVTPITAGVRYSAVGWCVGPAFI